MALISEAGGSHNRLVAGCVVLGPPTSPRAEMRYVVLAKLRLFSAHQKAGLLNVRLGGTRLTPPFRAAVSAADLGIQFVEVWWEDAPF